MKKVTSLTGQDYLNYLAWIKTDPLIPPGKTTIETFKEKSAGQKQLRNFQ